MVRQKAPISNPITIPAAVKTQSRSRRTRPTGPDSWPNNWILTTTFRSRDAMYGIHPLCSALSSFTSPHRFLLLTYSAAEDNPASTYWEYRLLVLAGAMEAVSCPRSTDIDPCKCFMEKTGTRTTAQIQRWEIWKRQRWSEVMNPAGATSANLLLFSASNATFLTRNWRSWHNVGFCES